MRDRGRPHPHLDLRQARPAGDRARNPPTGRPARPSRSHPPRGPATTGSATSSRRSTRRGNATRYTYDQLGRMVTQDEPATTNDDPRGQSLHLHPHRRGTVGDRPDGWSGRVDLRRPRPAGHHHRGGAQPGSRTTYTTTMVYDDAGQLVRSRRRPRVPSPANVLRLARPADPRDRPDRGVGAVRLRPEPAARSGRPTTSAGPPRPSTTCSADAVASEQAAGRTGHSSSPSVTTTTRPATWCRRPTRLGPPPPTPTTRRTNSCGRWSRSPPPPRSPRRSGTTRPGNRTRHTDGRGNTSCTPTTRLGLPESVIEPATTTHPNAADRTWTVGYDAGAYPAKITAPGGVTRAAHLRRGRAAGAGDRRGRVGRHQHPHAGLRPARPAHLGRARRAGRTPTPTTTAATCGPPRGPGGSADYVYDGDGN